MQENIPASGTGLVQLYPTIALEEKKHKRGGKNASARQQKQYNL
jgi:hypothetical protein